MSQKVATENDEAGERRALVASVYAAFKDEPVPSDKNIIDLSVGDMAERAAILQRYSKLAWWDSRIDLGPNSDDLYFMTDVGRRYYLPACLMAAVDENEGAMHASQVVRWLRMPGPDATNDERSFFEALKKLTPQQVGVVVEFLEFMVRYRALWFAHEEPKRALEEYWKLRGTAYVGT